MSKASGSSGLTTSENMLYIVGKTFSMFNVISYMPILVRLVQRK
jgi:hypothetical protein